MKINYRNTALSLLDDMRPENFRIIDDGGKTSMGQKMNLAHSIVRIWPNISPRFKRKIQFISGPFYDAYERAAHKIADVIDAEELDESGTFIYKASKSETNTIFYSINTTGKDKDFEMDATIIFFNSATDTDKPSLAVISQRRPGMPVGGARFYCSKKGQDAGLSPISVIADIFSLVLFMKYCEVETKTIKGGRKDTHIGTKYLNETKHEVTILDSTWFTTIVKSDGFHVRGHFRFQPCGQGMKDRKLIWIADYDKNGYTRTAQVLKTQ